MKRGKIRAQKMQQARGGHELGNTATMGVHGATVDNGERREGHNSKSEARFLNNLYMPSFFQSQL